MISYCAYLYINNVITALQTFLESQGIELNPPERMIFDPYIELRKMPPRMYVTPSDFDQLKQFLAFDKKVSFRFVSYYT